MSDDAVELIVVLLLAGHVAAAGWSIRTRRGAPILAVNVLVAAVVLVAIAWRWRFLFNPPDWPVIALTVFEAGAVATSLAARRATRGWSFAACGIFAVHLLATIAMLVFLLTFSLDRLI